MAMNRAQVAAIGRGLCGSLPQRRAALRLMRAYAGIRRHVQTMLWVRACHSAMVLTLSMLRKKLRQPAITCLGVGALRGRGPLLVDRLGVVTAHTVSPVGHARRIAGLRGMAVPIGVARLRHRHEGLDAVLGQRFDVVELGEAAVGEMLARSRAVLPGQGVVHRQHLAHVGADVVDRHTGDGGALGVGGELDVIGRPETTVGHLHDPRPSTTDAPASKKPPASPFASAAASCGAFLAARSASLRAASCCLACSSYSLGHMYSKLWPPYPLVGIPAYHPQR